MKIRKKILALTAGLLLGLAGTAVADTINIPLGGLNSCDGPGAPCNIVFDVDLGTAAGQAGGEVQLDALGWNIVIGTVGASWLSEAVISFQSMGGELFTLTPGVGDSFPGTAFYSSGGQIDLAGALGFNPLLPNGILTIELYESFDDVAGAIDAFYFEGGLTLDFVLTNPVTVPEPGTLALLGLGLAGLGLARRRKVA